MFTPRAATTHRNARLLLGLGIFLCGLAGLAGARPHAGTPQNPAPAPPASQKPSPPGGFRVKKDVDLVVLYASVLNQRGDFVPDLKKENFRIFEDRVEQQLSVFRHEDVPISVGLVVDNSGSMRDKRAKVNAAALTFVQTSNPEDQVFVVNFNDEFFLDLDKDFTSDVRELREALERVDARGATALRDALIGSMDHLKKGTRDKKVLLVITDGEDNASHKPLETVVEEAHKSGTLIYAIGLLNQEEKGSARRAKRALEALTTASGGAAYFPDSVEEVQAICTKIAHDIRNQYVLAYYPSNAARDGTFRSVKVDLVKPIRNYGKLNVRTRVGYYAPKPAAGN
jgi:Ca-activated chloride channel family protein